MDALWAESLEEPLELGERAMNIDDDVHLRQSDVFEGAT